MSLAWHTAKLGLFDAKHFPKLEKLLIRKARRAKPKPQTWQEQLSIMRMFTALHSPGRRRRRGKGGAPKP